MGVSGRLVRRLWGVPASGGPADGVFSRPPGAAAVMVIMAAEFGADARLVAFMRYFRVACVAGLASVIAAV
jgi:uncharacterized membrane protein AbrB (regulator of aidB expression)